MSNLNRVVKLTKDLIKIQSFKDGKIFESEIVKYICDYMNREIPWMDISLQEISENRYNIIAKDKYPTKFLVVDQIDTVEPTSSWNTDPLTPTIKDNKIYGLGSSDSKGNLASFLESLHLVGETKGLCVLWYADEEYLFEGIKYFTQSLESKSINPTYVLSIDGNDCKVGRGCRGLIEAQVTLRGVTAHSATGQGRDVNIPFCKTINILNDWLKNFESDFLEMPTLNVSRINSGILNSTANNIPIFSTQANKVPDYLEAVIEIRNTTKRLNSISVNNLLKQNFDKFNLDYSFKLVQEYMGFETDTQNLTEILNYLPKRIVRKGYLNPAKFGFLDVSMLSAIYPDANIFSFGIGSTSQAHCPNEYIEIQNLNMGLEVYSLLLINLVKSNE